MAALLAGVRVLDFGRYIAGPSCAMLLGELGADVIRIERLDGAEDRGLFPVGERVGAMFLQLNRNKRCLTLNPLKPAGREVVRRLVRTADIVVANLPDAALVSMGIDYESLCAVRPDIILAKVSAYGSTGPGRDKLGFDGTGQAMSGSMYLSGQGDTPMRSFTSWVDNGTSLALAFGVMAALLHRERTGEGQVVESSLLGTSLAFMAIGLIEQQLAQRNRRAIANRSAAGGPSDAFRSQDGKWLLVQVTGDGMFKRWTELMGESHWLADPRFGDDISRSEHAEILSARMGAWCAERDAASIVATLEAAGIPCAPIHSPAEALADPQVQGGGFLTTSSYPGLAGPVPLVNVPVKFSRTEARVQRPAPQLGEHTDSILAELGFSADEIREMHAARIA